MLSLLFRKAIDAISSGVSVPAIIILSIAVSISTSIVYKSLSSSY